MRIVTAVKTGKDFMYLACHSMNGNVGCDGARAERSRKVCKRMRQKPVTVPICRKSLFGYECP